MLCEFFPGLNKIDPILSYLCNDFQSYDLYTKQKSPVSPSTYFQIPVSSTVAMKEIPHVLSSYFPWKDIWREKIINDQCQCWRNIITNLLMILVQRTVLHSDIIMMSLPLKVTHFVGWTVPHTVLVVIVHHAGQLHQMARLHHQQSWLGVDDEKWGSWGYDCQGHHRHHQHDALFPQLRKSGLNWAESESESGRSSEDY